MTNAIKCLGTVSNENIIEENKVVVNGVQHKLAYINSSTVENENSFPAAPDGTKTYDTATGVVVEHASAAEAFEGLVTNGDFRNGVTGWSLAGSGAGTATIDSTGFTLNGDNTTGSCYVISTGDMVIGESYDIEFTVVVTSGNLKAMEGTDGTKIVKSGLTTGTHVIKGYVAQSTANLSFQAHVASTAAKVTRISILPVTESVITSRQDYAFMEAFHEKISNKDVVYPLGNVQYGASTWEGITLSNTLVAQGYSAFGEWDTVTTGYGVTWSTLTEAQKVTFLQDPENNIYSDDGELIQVRYRIRVIEGLGDEWAGTSVTTDDLTYGSLDDTAVKPRGILDTSVPDLAGRTSAVINGLYASIHSSRYPLDATKVIGQFVATNGGANAGNLPSTYAHNGLCFAIPIALVQRRNKGAYHPSFNSNGCAKLNTTGAFISGGRWWGSTTIDPVSTSECFIPISDGNTNFTDVGYAVLSGYIGVDNGRSDDKFYDAIYASDVQDLRMSSRRVPVTELREHYKRKAIAGTVRGFEGVPFTKVYDDVGSGSDANANTKWLTQSDGRIRVFRERTVGKGTTGEYVYLYDKTLGMIIRGIIGNSYSSFFDILPPMIVYSGTVPAYPSEGTGNEVYYIIETEQLHKQANPTWTDIIGDPANIAATFPNGVEGQWIPEIPDGTSKLYPANRKVTKSTAQFYEYTTDTGNTWTASSTSYDTTLNGLQLSTPATTVRLNHYETQAHFTEDDVNSEVIELGGVTYSKSAKIQYGCLLNSSLAGVINSSNSFSEGTGNILLQGYSTYPNTSLSNSATVAPNHNSITLSGAAGLPAVKTLDYLSKQDGVGKLCYVYKQMVYDDGADAVNDFVDITETTAINTLTVGQVYHLVDGVNQGVWQCVSTGSSSSILTNQLVKLGDLLIRPSDNVDFFKVWDGNGWGDNNQFEIVNNQGTITDDNGNTCLYGTASFNTQYFIDGSN